jgi:hypothetical protein
MMGELTSIALVFLLLAKDKRSIYFVGIIRKRIYSMGWNAILNSLFPVNHLSTKGIKSEVCLVRNYAISKHENQRFDCFV